IANKQLNAQISQVNSKKTDSYIIQIAADYNITTKYIAAKGLTREQYDELVVAEIQKSNPDLILLIGFMRILSSVFIKA
ncbi:phosphoribosylglycinamide formyltransferase, partial [Francisella tularensis subsp. holarctica]|uniref:formyltransferase family protein n=1 Tax=Francisella tularensis TaxID=263 RepID=UPI002381B2B3